LFYIVSYFLNVVFVSFTARPKTGRKDLRGIQKSTMTSTVFPRFGANPTAAMQRRIDELTQQVTLLMGGPAPLLQQQQQPQEPAPALVPLPQQQQPWYPGPAAPRPYMPVAPPPPVAPLLQQQQLQQDPPRPALSLVSMHSMVQQAVGRVEELEAELSTLRSMPPAADDFEKRNEDRLSLLEQAVYRLSQQVTTLCNQVSNLCTQNVKFEERLQAAAK
jgi:hypothetical protein